MKFAHLADCHLGGWKLPELQQLNLLAFEKAIDVCIKEKVEFVLIAGDLFDVAMPGLDILKAVVSNLKELHDKNIDCYIIPGSHDYSASGKTFLDVIEKAGLCINVGKVSPEKEEKIGLEFFQKNNLLIAGIPGKKLGLEKEIIKKVKKIDKKNKEEFRILMLHTALDEAMPELNSISMEELPDGFDYYALGHIHKPFYEKSGKVVVYPGPLFPNNFSELEELGSGGFFIIDAEKEKINAERHELKLKDTIALSIDAGGKSPEAITREILNILKSENIDDKIVLLRVYGTLSNGKTSDINWKEVQEASGKCYVLLKNISKLESPEFKIQVDVKAENIEQIEKEIASEKKDEFSEFIFELLRALAVEKQEGESSSVFEKRAIEEFSKIFRINLK